MLLMGIDLGTSSVKVSVFDSASMRNLGSAQYPSNEAPILSEKPGWAEQSPSDWWEYVQKAILQLHARQLYDPIDIAAIGIAYQMHGLVLVDKDQQVLRNSIIWCDSRAVRIGEQAFVELGKDNCLQSLLNSPGNFTLSKLAWVKQHEPAIFNRINRFILPGDFIAMKLTGHITTTVSALSEAVCWDFRQKKASIDLFNYFGIDESLIPEIQPVFAEHGRLSAASSKLLSLREGIPVSYKAGDQLNNALSLDVLEPGEVAANAGTSGVIYGITDKLEYDKDSRVNSFAHVNYRPDNHTRIGVLLCINGTGIMNRWIKQLTGNDDYNSMNNQAEIINTGGDGLLVLPFGNGAERMLGNKTPGAQILGIDLNIHGKAHVFRAVQEGIVFSFRYGLDILRSNGLHPSVIRAGNSNMFLSSLFCKAFVNCLQTPLELYDTDGSTGAAIGAGIGAGFFTAAEAFGQLKPLQRIEPIRIHEYEIYYGHWLHELKKFID